MTGSSRSSTATRSSSATGAATSRRRSPIRRASSRSTRASSRKWVLTVDGERLNPLSTDDLHYFETRFFLVPGTGTVYVDAKLSVIRRRARRRRLPRGADDPQPRRRAGRPDGPDRRRVRLRRPVRGQGRAREEGHVHARGREAASSCSATSARRSRGRRASPSTAAARRSTRAGSRSTCASSRTASGRPSSTSRSALLGSGDARPRRRRGADAGRTWRRTSSAGSTTRRARVRLGAARGDVPAQPRRPRRAALLAADRGRHEPAGRRSAVVHDDVRPRQHLHQPAGAAVHAGARGDDAARAGRLAGHARRRLPRRGPGSDPARDALRRDDGVRGAAALAVLRLRRRDAALRRAARRVRALDRRHASSCASSSTRRARRSTGSTSTPTCMGNGYVSYQRRNEETGLENQCWKDSWDSISYRDGRLPGFPRATCELQGYAYDAKVRGARLARLVWKDAAFADSLEKQAADLKRRFNRDFWVEDGEYFALALDAEGQPGRLADVEQRPPALERHRRQVEGEGGRAPPDGPAAVLAAGASARWPRARAATTRSATTSARSGRSTTRSSPGVCAATASRRRPRAIAAGILDAAEFFDGRLPEAFGGYERSVTKYPVAVPDRVQPAGVVDRRAAAAAPHDARPRADRRPPRRRPGAAGGDRTPRAARHPRPLGPHRRLRPRPRRGHREGRHPQAARLTS